MMARRVQETNKLNDSAFSRIGVLEVEGGVVTKSYAVERYVSCEPLIRISTNESDAQDGDWICEGAAPYYLAGKIGREITIDYDY